jgi:hypothetical protein
VRRPEGFTTHFNGGTVIISFAEASPVEGLWTAELSWEVPWTEVPWTAESSAAESWALLPERATSPNRPAGGIPRPSHNRRAGAPAAVASEESVREACRWDAPGDPATARYREAVVREAAEARRREVAEARYREAVVREAGVARRREVAEARCREVAEARCREAAA